MVVLWVRTLVQKGRTPFDSVFDFEFFDKAVGVMLNLPEIYTSYKCLWMLNKALQYFPRKSKSRTP